MIIGLGPGMLLHLLEILFFGLVMILVLVFFIVLMRMEGVFHGLMLFMMMGLNLMIHCLFFNLLLLQFLIPVGSKEL